MRTFPAVLATAMMVAMASADQFDTYKDQYGVRFSSREEGNLRHYLPADATALGKECSWIKECSASPPPGCEQYPFHERPCSCLTPAAKCMYAHWKQFSTSQREAMYDRCGQTQFPFGVHMHYLQQNNCDFANVAQEELDKQREAESDSISCDWTLADGMQSAIHVTYEHVHYCMRAPGWPSPAQGKGLNYTEHVLQYSGGQQIRMELHIHDDAGVDYHYYTADNSASKSGKLEPGHDLYYCSNALNPHFYEGTDCSAHRNDQPHIGETGRKWVLYVKNRNWIHKAHFYWKLGPNCFNGLDCKGDYSLCTNKVVNWGFVYGSLNTFYAINGCEMFCNGGFSTNPCCITTGNSPSSSTGCGENCSNCKGGCPSRTYYQRGSK